MTKVCDKKGYTRRTIEVRRVDGRIWECAEWDALGNLTRPKATGAYWMMHELKKIWLAEARARLKDGYNHE